MRRLLLALILLLVLAPTLAWTQSGGPFVRSGCSSLTSPVAHGTACFDTTTGVGRWKVWDGSRWVAELPGQSGGINIKDYGAVGDGSTDDTSAIQAALTAAAAARSATFVPPGTFIYTALTLPSNTQLVGIGTLKLAASQNAAADVYSLTASSVSNILIAGITLDGNKTNQSGGFKAHGMLIRGVTNFEILNVTWKDWHYHGISLTSATQGTPVDADTAPADPSDIIQRGRIANNLFTNIGRNTNDGSGFGDAQALQIGSTVTDLSVVGNVLIDCINGIKAAAFNRRLAITGNIIVNESALAFANTGISAEQLTVDTAISGNTVVGPYQDGILLEGPQRLAVSGNVVRNAVRGITAAGSAVSGVNTNVRSLTIAGNTVSGSTSEAIRVVHSSQGEAIDITVTGNSTSGGTYGIFFGAVLGGTIAGNTVRGSATGIASQNGSNHITITGNRVNGATGEGLYFSGANNHALVSSNVSTGNAYGLDIASGQAGLMVSGNRFHANSTFDIRNASGNVVFTPDNHYYTTSGTVVPVVAPGAPSLVINGLTSTGAASGKKVVCVDTTTGQLYASSTGTDCSN